MSFLHEASQPQAVGEAANVVLRNVPCEAAALVTHVVKMVAGVAYRAQADVKANSNAIGVIESKSSSTLCNIRVSGITPEIFVGLDEAEEYYLDEVTAGQMKTTPPTSTGNVVMRVGQPYSPTRLLVNKGIRMIRT